MPGPRILVVGAGPAGVRAAQTIVEAGIACTVIDEAETSGGQIYRRQPGSFQRSGRVLYGSEHERARNIHQTFERLGPLLSHCTGSLAWNIENGVLHVLRDKASQAMPFDALILATGATDRIVPVRGWTAPGVYTLGAAQIALKAQGCGIGASVAFLGTGPLLYLVASQYVAAGGSVAAVLDTAPTAAGLVAMPDLLARPGTLAKGLALMARLRLSGVTLLSGVRPVAIETGATGAVTGISVEARRGAPRTFACDAVGLGWHLKPETQLADLARCHFAFDEVTHLWSPHVDEMGRTSVRGIYAAGDGVRILGADAAETSGRLAGLAALIDLQVLSSSSSDLSSRIRRLQSEHRRMDRFRRGLARGFPWPANLAASIPDDVIICRCEGIDAGCLRDACRVQGAPEINRAKAFSRVGMGRCQGRYCGSAAAEVIAATLGEEVDSVGRLRGQAPVKPISIKTVTEGIG